MFLNREIERIRDFVEQWTAPVWFSRGIEEAPSNVNDNGSAGFVCSGNNRFLITAKHVIDGYRAAKSRDSNVVFAINIGNGNTVVLAEPQIIAESSVLDVATLHFPDLDLNRGKTSKAYFPLDEFKPRRAKKGEPATIVGFPAQGRHAFETFGLFEPHPIGMLVTSASDNSIVLADENGEVRFERHGRHLEDGLKLGGFSGSPAFGVTYDCELYLMGIVRHGSERLGCAGEPGFLFLGSAEYLQGDGTFDLSRMPCGYESLLS